MRLSAISNFNRIEGNFIGHMINDYVDMSFLDQNKYLQLSTAHENVTVDSKIHMYEFKSLGLRIHASKNIRKDSELFFMYGVTYWEKYSNPIVKDEVELELEILKP